MNAAEREAERRYPLWLPTGDYEIDREDYSELDAQWQNYDTERDRAHFVQGAKWQAEREREAEFRARFPNGEVVGESRINAGAAVNALYEAHAEYPFVIEDERIVVEKRTVGPWEVIGDE
ncbi:hypothetical protein EG850_11065 [Gulosibacter macacae]|uniref:Uncharacterized protein n=1 Tax=Gulosibacter macacae TaxID=2488791 RepID=A0A3P3VVB6_9MICO|nr:hypothetical protein [Gulosibacter macacae]RRJ85918.1 hypothetical protein EG850_11065 [Gulosibacter macacae]